MNEEKRIVAAKDFMKIRKLTIKKDKQVNSDNN